MYRKYLTLTVLVFTLTPGLGYAQDDEKAKNRKQERLNALGRNKGQKGGAPNEAGPLGGMLPGPMMMQMFPVMAALDADQDGTLSAREIENASKSLMKLDKNGDGVISAEELRPDPSKFQSMMGGIVAGGKGMLAGQPSATMMMRMFETRDKNGDGKLSGDEIPEQLKNRLAAIDQDGDGAIQKSEIERAASMITGGGLRPGRGNGNNGSGVKPKRPSEE